MSRKIIGIIGSTMEAKDQTPPRHLLNRTYVWAVEQAGGIPIILPVTTDEAVRSHYLGLIDGLLLSGGVDVAPACYGQPPHPKLGEVDSDRDATELPLLKDALAEDRPIFAICRGLQMLNVALGGTLYQDLPSEFPTNIHHQQADRKIPRAETVHSIAIAPDSRLRSIVGADTMQVNSLHHQALHSIGQGLTITAQAPDGVIEAAEMLARRFVVGVQFHPEDLAPYDVFSQRLFAAFVAAC